MHWKPEHSEHSMM